MSAATAAAEAANFLLNGYRGKTAKRSLLR